MTASVDTPTIGLGQLIKENTFRVPKHQRDYLWSLDYVNQFIDDVEKSLEKSSDEYFLGLMVFTRDEKTSRLNVIDGQQRLATTIMLMSAIRNWMAFYPEMNKTAEQISERYIGYSELGSDVIQEKLILNTINHDTFLNYVIGRASLEDIERNDSKIKRSDRNKPLIESAMRLAKYVREKASKFNTTSDAKDYFVSLLNYIHNSVRVVSLIPGGDEDAYTIFETLNDRGLALAPLDLVKNLIFSRAERYKTGGLQEMEARWNEMMTILERSRIDSFLKAYWASRYGLVEGPKLYGAFKRKFDSPKGAYGASLEMREVAENFVAVSDASDPIWSSYPDNKARTLIENISILGATQLYPLILSAIDRFNRHEMVRLLRLIEVIAVRYQLVARGRPGRMESLGSQSARRIHDGTIKTAADVRVELAEIYPGDDTFLSDFKTKTEKDKRKAHYILRVLDREYKRHHALESAEDDAPSDEITYEHIMPKSLTVEWSNYLGSDAERHEEYKLRIGNMCLISKRANQKLGNKLFSEKKKILSASRIPSTSALGDYDDWRCEQIDHRQSKMAKLAVQAWRFQ